MPNVTAFGDSAITAALAGASQIPFWLDSSQRPHPLPALRGRHTTNLAVVGGGYTGLWAALIAKERDPGRRVTLVEGKTLGWAASGHNGGFCSASLTHGAANGRNHFPQEADTLLHLGMDNLDELEQTVAKYSIECDFERTGSMRVATEPHQVAWLEEETNDSTGVRFLNQEAVRREVDSPTYLAGLWDIRGSALVDPARLVWGLRDACVGLGVEIFENTSARSVEADHNSVTVTTDEGCLVADRVVLATNAFPSMLRRTRLHTVPVYDYALMTEPLTEDQIASIGWQNRQGLDEVSNRFHYYRRTRDNRILFGGFDAIYHYGRQIRAKYNQRPATFHKLARHFFETFPQLTGLKFSHQWGGAIDTCSRFCPFFTTAAEGRIAYSAGYTGLGVGSTRFGAKVLLDMLSGEKTELTELDMVKKMPVPFPPEPLAWMSIKLTVAALIRADRREGRRGPWLKLLDAFGVGFDS